MLKNITELGPREAEFITLFASGSKKFFTNKEANEFWKNPEIAKKKLSLLEKKGWITRIERGKYMVIPLEAGPQRLWSENPFVIAGMLSEPSCIGYWSAIHFWNWTEQIPRIVYIQTTQRKNTTRKSIMGVKFEIVTLPINKYFGQIKQWEGESFFLITDKEKTLIDCAHYLKRSGGIEELYKAVKNAATEIDFIKLNDYVSKFKNGAVKKRLGFLFETIAPDLNTEAINILDNWKVELSAGISPLIPGGSKKGKVNSRWRLLINAQI